MKHCNISCILKQQTLQMLDKENEDAHLQLISIVERGEQVLGMIQAAKHDIAMVQLNSQPVVDFNNVDIDFNEDFEKCLDISEPMES